MRVMGKVGKPNCCFIHVPMCVCMRLGGCYACCAVESTEKRLKHMMNMPEKDRPSPFFPFRFHVIRTSFLFAFACRIHLCCFLASLFILEAKDLNNVRFRQGAGFADNAFFLRRCASLKAAVSSFCLFILFRSFLFEFVHL